MGIANSIVDSRSLKDLTKAISVSLAQSSSPIPSSLVQNLHKYVESHAEHDEDHAQRLQDELRAIYTSQVLNNPPGLAPFLAILGILKPLIAGSGRLIQWWKILFEEVLQNLGTQKGLAQEARDIILDLLVVDTDSKESDTLRDQQDTAHEIRENLISFWMAKSVKALQEIDMQARFVETQLLHILLSYGRRRPRVSCRTMGRDLYTDMHRTGLLDICEPFFHNTQHENPGFDLTRRIYT